MSLLCFRKLNMPQFPVMNKDKLNVQLKEWQSKLIKPMTKENAFYHYLPMLGVKSYMELSVTVFNPSLMIQIYKK